MLLIWRKIEATVRRLEIETYDKRVLSTKINNEIMFFVQNYVATVIFY